MDLVAATGMPCADGGLQSRAALWQRFEVGPKSPGRRAAGLQSTMIATSYTTKSSTAPRAFVCTEWRRTWNWTHAT